MNKKLILSLCMLSSIASMQAISWAGIYTKVSLGCKTALSCINWKYAGLGAIAGTAALLAYKQLQKRAIYSRTARCFGEILSDAHPERTFTIYTNDRGNICAGEQTYSKAPDFIIRISYELDMPSIIEEIDKVKIMNPLDWNTYPTTTCILKKNIKGSISAAVIMSWPIQSNIAIDEDEYAKLDENMKAKLIEFKGQTVPEQEKTSAFTED